MTEPVFPNAIDPDKVGHYDAHANAGGGYTWDAVLEYRVWMHPDGSAPDEFDGNDYYIPFSESFTASDTQALIFSFFRLTPFLMTDSHALFHLYLCGL